MTRNPIDQATFVLQVFNHLSGTAQHIATGKRYLITLAGQFRSLGIHHEYLSEAVSILRKLESDLTMDINKMNNKLAKVDLSDDLIVTIE